MSTLRTCESSHLNFICGSARGAKVLEYQMQETCNVLLHYENSKRSVCPLYKLVYSFKVVKLFSKHLVRNLFRTNNSHRFHRHCCNPVFNRILPTNSELNEILGLQPHPGMPHNVLCRYDELRRHLPMCSPHVRQVQEETLHIYTYMESQGYVLNHRLSTGGDEDAVVMNWNNLTEWLVFSSQ
jgi:hypothetical protein